MCAGTKLTPSGCEINRCFAGVICFPILCEEIGMTCSEVGKRWKMKGKKRDKITEQAGLGEGESEQDESIENL